MSNVSPPLLAESRVQHAVLGSTDISGLTPRGGAGACSEHQYRGLTQVSSTAVASLKHPGASQVCAIDFLSNFSRCRRVYLVLPDVYQRYRAVANEVAQIKCRARMGARRSLDVSGRQDHAAIPRSIGKNSLSGTLPAMTSWLTSSALLCRCSGCRRTAAIQSTRAST